MKTREETLAEISELSEKAARGTATELELGRLKELQDKILKEIDPGKYSYTLDNATLDEIQKNLKKKVLADDYDEWVKVWEEWDEEEQDTKYEWDLGIAP